MGSRFGVGAGVGVGRGSGNLRDGVLKVLVARRISEAVRRPDGVEPSVIQHAEPDDRKVRVRVRVRA